MQSGQLSLRKLGLIGMAVVMLLYVTACGAAESPSAPQQPAQPAAASPAQPAVQGTQGGPSVPQQPAQPAAAAPAATAAPLPTPSFIQPGAIPKRAVPTPPAAMSMGPEGSLVMADEDIDFPARVPKKTGCTDHDNNIRWGVDEGAIFWSAEEVAYEPGLATAWEFSDDLLQLTFDIRKGVQYHDGWGEVTGHDWKWAWETTMEEDSIFPIFLGRDHIDRIDVPDDYTVTMYLTKPNIFFLDTNIPSAGCGSVPFASKKRVDELGEEEAHTNLTGGTGPFKFTTFHSGDRAVLEAVPGHWRNDSNYASVNIVEIPESATQVAALLVGEVDSAIVPVTQAARFEGSKVELRRQRGGGYQRLYSQGRFCMKVSVDGTVPVDPYPRPGYDPTKPWVGNCDSPEEQENARKVRWAVSMSIDRQGIVDNILGGFGRPAGPAEMNGVTFDKYFLDKWSVPYDPDMARQYLADAGWPDGFEMEMRCTTGHPLMVEMCEAIAKGMTDVGLDVNIVTLAYSANRPCVVARECGNWWFRTGGEGLGLNPEIALLRRNTVRTFNPGFEIREQLEILAQIDACKSSECLDELREVHWDWWHHNQQIIGVVETYGLFGVNIEKVGEWKIPFGMGGLAAFDRIQKP